MTWIWTNILLLTVTSGTYCGEHQGDKNERKIYISGLNARLCRNTETTGTKLCMILNTLHNHPLQDIKIPEEACVADSCHNCVTTWRSYFVDKHLKLHKIRKVVETQERVNNTIGVESKMYQCTRNTLPCGCTQEKCDGTKDYCDVQNCTKGSECRCEVIPARNILTAYDSLNNPTQNPWRISFQECLLQRSENTDIGRIRRRLLGDTTKQEDDIPESTDILSQTLTGMNQDSNNFLKFTENNLQVWFKQPVFKFSRAGALILTKDNLKRVIMVSKYTRTAQIPPEMTVLGGEINFIFLSDHGTLQQDKVPIVENGLCYRLKCILCPDVLYYFKCIPSTLRAAIIALGIVLLGLVVKYIRAIIKTIFEVVYIVYRTVRFVFYLGKRASRASMSLGILSGDRFKKKGQKMEHELEKAVRQLTPRVDAPTVLQIAIIALLILPIISELHDFKCGNHVVIPSDLTTCYTNGTVRQCNVTTVTSASIKYLGDTACLYMTDKDRNFVLELKVTYLEVICKIPANLQYLTFPIGIDVSTSIKCPQNDHCGWQAHCYDNTHAGDFSYESKRWPGETACFPIGPSQSGCFVIHEDGCAYYRYYMEADYSKTYGVYSLGGMKCYPKLYIEEKVNGTTQVYQTQGDVTTPFGLRVKIVGIFDSPYPALNEELVTSWNKNYMEEAYLIKTSPLNQPRADSIGATQASRMYDRDFIYDKSAVRCYLSGDNVRCSYPDSHLDNMDKYYSKQRLPLNRGFYHYFVKGETLQGTSLQPGAIDVLFTLKDYKVQVDVTHVCPEIKTVETTSGCYACEIGGTLTIKARSSCQEGNVRVIISRAIVKTEVIYLKYTVEEFVIRFTTIEKCIDTAICLSGANIHCSKLQICLDDPDLSVVEQNRTEVVSQDVSAEEGGIFKGFSVNGIFGSFTAGIMGYVYPLLLTVAGIVVPLIVLYVISACMAIFRN